MLTLSEPVRIRTTFGVWTTHVGLFGDGPQKLICGSPDPAIDAEVPLLRIQYGCIHGTIFQSLECDCGSQVRDALRLLSQVRKRCLFVYFPDHEAYGLGIFEKMALINRERQRGGSFPGPDPQIRSRPPSNGVLWVIPALLNALGLPGTVLLISDSPDKQRALEGTGVEVRERVGLGSVAARFRDPGR